MVIRASLLSQQITVLTAGQTTDGYGNATPDWTAAASRTVPAYVRPAPASEDIVDRNAVTSQWQVHTNDLDITAVNRVVFDGATYEVDGQPLVWRADPRGRTGHAKFLLRRVEL